MRAILARCAAVCVLLLGLSGCGTFGAFDSVEEGKDLLTIVHRQVDELTGVKVDEEDVQGRLYRAYALSALFAAFAEQHLGANPTRSDAKDLWEMILDVERDIKETYDNRTKDRYFRDRADVLGSLGALAGRAMKQPVRQVAGVATGGTRERIVGAARLLRQALVDRFHFEQDVLVYKASICRMNNIKGGGANERCTQEAARKTDKLTLGAADNLAGDSWQTMRSFVEGSCLRLAAKINPTNPQQEFKSRPCGTFGKSGS